MTAPWDSQFGIWYWSLEALDWVKFTPSDWQELFEGGFYTTAFTYDASDNLEYLGLAEPGTLKSQTGWKIIKFTYNASGLVTDKQFANGETLFNKIFDNRTSYSYS